MSFVAWIVWGLISGFIASKVIDGRARSPLRNMALGVLGALVGGVLFYLVGETGGTSPDYWRIFFPVLGAATVLVSYHVIIRRPSRA